MQGKGLGKLPMLIARPARAEASVRPGAEMQRTRVSSLRWGPNYGFRGTRVRDPSTTVANHDAAHALILIFPCPQSAKREGHVPDNDPRDRHRDTFRRVRHSVGGLCRRADAPDHLRNASAGVFGDRIPEDTGTRDASSDARADARADGRTDA